MSDLIVCHLCGTSYKSGERHACASILRCHHCGEPWPMGTFHECKGPKAVRDPLLVKREKTHGSFEVHARTTNDFKDILHKMPNWDTLSPRHKEALHMIAHKIGRIASGNPNFKDHWDDIAGYAKLASEACD